MTRRCAAFSLAQARRAARHLRVRVPAALLREGMNVEREHADVYGCSPTMAARIALAHLRERPDCYKRLKKYVE